MIYSLISITVIEKLRTQIVFGVLAQYLSIHKSLSNVM